MALELYSKLLYCPRESQGAKQLIKNLLDEGNLATLLLATINTIQNSKIKDPTVWRGFRDVYEVLEVELGLLYGKIILAVSSMEEVGDILARDWPYLDAYRNEVDACLKGDCSGVSTLVGDLKPTHLGHIFSPHLTETENDSLPFALIPFCEYRSNMTKYGKKISHMSLPVCSNFKPTLIFGQLCYKMKAGHLVEENREAGGLNILLDPVPATPDANLKFTRKAEPKDSMLTFADKSSQTTKADIYIPMLEGYRGVGDNEYLLTSLKLMTATDDFLRKDQRFRGCSSKSFEDCQAGKFLQEVVKKCHCVPWNLSPLLSTQVKSTNKLRPTLEIIRLETSAPLPPTLATRSLPGRTLDAKKPALACMLMSPTVLGLPPWKTLG